MVKSHTGLLPTANTYPIPYSDGQWIDLPGNSVATRPGAANKQGQQISEYRAGATRLGASLTPAIYNYIHSETTTSIYSHKLLITYDCHFMK
jgi:hypothetical protein